MKSITFVTRLFAAAGFLAPITAPVALAQATSAGPGATMPGRPNAPIAGEQDTSTTTPARGPRTTEERIAADPTGQATVTTPNAPVRHGVPGLDANGQRIQAGSNAGSVYRP